MNTLFWELHLSWAGISPLTRDYPCSYFFFFLLLFLPPSLIFHLLPPPLPSSSARFSSSSSFLQLQLQLNLKPKPHILSVTIVELGRVSCSTLLDLRWVVVTKRKNTTRISTCLLEGEKRWKRKHCNRWGAPGTSWVEIDGGGEGNEEDEKWEKWVLIDCKKARWAEISPLRENWKKLN